MNDTIEKNVNTTTKYLLFPEERLFPAYPFIVWSIGWLAILKSVIWLFTDPNGTAEMLNITGYKYIVFMIPLFITGTGIWNKKKWAIWGLIVICILEIIFFLIYPQSLHTLVLDNLSNLTLLLSVLIFIINGPIADIIILLMLPFVFKFSE